MNQFRSAAMRVTSAGSYLAGLKHFARSVVPSRADFCFIHVVESRCLRCAASAHATLAGQRLVNQISRLDRRIDCNDSCSTAAQVVRTGRPQLRTLIAIDFEPTPRSKLVDLHVRLAPRSALVVPLVSDRTPLGALTLGYAESNRRYTSGDLPAARQLARNIAALLSSRRPSARSRSRMLRRTPSLSKRRLRLTRGAT